MLGSRHLVAFAVRLAYVLEPLRAIAAGRATAVDTEESLVATFKPMCSVDIVPWIAGRGVDGPIVVLVKELGARARR